MATSEKVSEANMEPWFRKHTGWWCIRKNGVLINLAKGKGAYSDALKALQRLDDQQVHNIFTKFLADLAKRAPSTTIINFNRVYERFPDVYISELTPQHVEQLWEEQTRWNNGSRKYALLAIQAALNWAASARSNWLIEKNPLKGLRGPVVQSRSVECLVAPVEYDTFLQAVPEDLRNIIFALRLTGTRPSTVSRVTAKEFFPTEGVWKVSKHKTAKKTGKPVIVVLPPELVSLCKKLVRQYPKGPLFRTARGEAWNPQKLARRVGHYRDKLGIKQLIAYSFRHGRAQELLEGGVSDSDTAAILGLTSTAMIHKHYSHISERTRRLKDIALENLEGDRG